MTTSEGPAARALRLRTVYGAFARLAQVDDGDLEGFADQRLGASVPVRGSDLRLVRDLLREIGEAMATSDASTLARLHDALSVLRGARSLRSAALRIQGGLLPSFISEPRPPSSPPAGASAPPPALADSVPPAMAYAEHTVDAPSPEETEGDRSTWVSVPMVTQSALPFVSSASRGAARNEEVPFSPFDPASSHVVMRLSLERYAALRAELRMLEDDHAHAVAALAALDFQRQSALARYGIESEEQFLCVEASFRDRFMDEPTLGTRFRVLVAGHITRLRAGAA